MILVLLIVCFGSSMSKGSLPTRRNTIFFSTSLEMSFVAIQKLALQPLFLGSQLEGTILIHDLLSFFLLDLFSYKNQGKEIARN
jgi:hypothetical protein